MERDGRNLHDKARHIQQMKLPQTEGRGELAHRLPPGQMWTERFPILHEGEVPVYDMAKWTLRLFGEIEEELTLSYQELLDLPQRRIQCDIHCVTRWSKADTVWEGVLLRDVLERVRLKPEARFVMVHADPGYETNLPLEVLMGDQILLAHTFDGKPLTPKHGWPLRLIVPQLYFWKSAKWIRGLEFMREDRTGFWERNGYHNEADPFQEQRFSGEPKMLPEDEWVQKDYD